MDGGIALSPEEIKGRNAWNLWTAGNQHFWNVVAQDSFGLMDLLKSLDNRKYKRGERFKVIGLDQSARLPRRRPSRMSLVSGSMNRPNRSPRESTRRFMAKPTGVLGFACFQIRSSTRKRARNGTASAT